jgi:hypothetical protein
VIISVIGRTATQKSKILITIVRTGFGIKSLFLIKAKIYQCKKP